MVPRRAKILRTDLRVHGYTVGCEGCKAALAGKPARTHSEKCRKRMEELMRSEPRVKEANARVDRFISKAIEREEEAKKKRKADGGTARGGAGRWSSTA